MYPRRLIINLMLCCTLENSYEGKSYSNFTKHNYILAHFYYCSSVWLFCVARDADKLEPLNKRILRFILGDYMSPYDTLLSKVNSTSWRNKRV